MHADIIVVGHRCEAFLAGYLFAQRGYRTLLIAPPGGPSGAGQHMFLNADAAERMSPVAPPPETVLARQVTFEFWSPDERARTTLRQAPLLLVEESAWCRYLARRAAETRNFKILRNLVPDGVLLRGDTVVGVRLSSGDELRARTVVECDALQVPLYRELTSIWPYPLARPFVGQLTSQKRRVGAAASAWDLGTCAVRIKPSRYMAWTYRYATDALDVGALVPGGFNVKPQPVVERVYREAGLLDSSLVGGETFEPHLGYPLPVPVAPGYLAVGQAAGLGSGFLPSDRTATLTSVIQGHVAAVSALDDGLRGMAGLWDYVRAVNRDWGRRQAFVNVLTAGLMRFDAARLEQLVRTGLLDTYALSCLVLGRVLEEDLLDSLARHGRALARPGTLITWRKLIKRARRLADSYAEIPLTFDRDTARKWQEGLVAQWQQ